MAKSTDKVKIRLTNVPTETWSHQEFAEYDDNDVITGYKEFHKDDVVEVSADTAEHLVNLGQAEIVKG